MTRRNIEAIYPLSPLQQGMLFHHLYEAHSGVDIEQVVYTLHDGLHVAAFKRAWQQVVDRHAALRTGFQWEGLDSPLQLVHRQIKLEWEEVDWRLLPAAEQGARLDDYLRREQPYDCAGAVKSERLGIALFERIVSDDPTALIGLPLIALIDLLRAEGVIVVGKK